MKILVTGGAGFTPHQLLVSNKNKLNNLEQNR
jgi:hypothetical protein